VLRDALLHFRVAVAVSLPVVFAFLGLKCAVGLTTAYRNNELKEVFARNTAYYSVVGVANGLLLGLFLYGWLIESQWIEVVHQTIRVETGSSLRVAHLSDLHIQAFGKRERAALDHVRAAKPDLICLTGDYLRSGSDEASVPSARRFLRELDAPHGVYAVTGNWDFDPGPLFSGLKIELLLDRFVDVTVRGTKVRLGGCRFGGSPRDLEEPPDDALNILLLHSPDHLEEVSRLGYDLYLAGHTHGGQVWIPGIGAIVRMSKRGYNAGLYTMGDTSLYVNRGLGAEGGPLPEFRLFCRPEVTLIDVEEAGE
jgi:predicted MPP superfamily phosphohydrolase